MTAKKAVVRRATGAALVLVLALAVVGSAAAARARDRTPPTTPTNLRVTALSHKSVTLAWNPSTDNSGRVTYVVSKDGQGFTVPQGQTTYTIDWLSPGRTYTFYVTATDTALNQSGKSNTVTVTTPRDTTPPTAPELSGIVRGPSQISLTWTKSTDDLATFVGYRIFANGAPVTQHVNWWGERTVVLRHLTPATSYTFTVQASDSNDNTATSNAVTLTTEPSSDVTPPSAPTNLRIVEDQGCAEIWLGWSQSTDDTDTQSAIEYEIYVNGVLSPLAVGARNRHGLRLRHGERREHVHREGGRSGRQHLGGEQRGDGGALALLRSDIRDTRCRVGRRRSGRPCRAFQRAAK